MLDALHPEMLEGLLELPTDQPVALLTRHSIREEPQNGFASYDVPLTESGVALAKALGERLNRPIETVFSSPVQRCMDTAEAMLVGAGLDLEVKASSLLVEPGSYVQQIDKVAGLFFKLGPIEFANKHLRGEVRGVLSPQQGTVQILKHLKSNLGSEKSLSLHVTHDTILAAFVYSLMNVSDIDEAHWPWMMEGVCVWFEEDMVHWIWRGKHYQLDNWLSI